MAKKIDKSLGDEKTRLRDKAAAVEPETARSLSDSQTLVGGLAADAETLSDGLELTDLSARYTIVKPLGQGGMGEVLLATDNRLKRQVAIERIRGEHARSRAAVQRFLTEAQAIAALNHPNIVQVYDYGRDQEGPFLIMEYVDGQSLLERCKDNPLPVAEAVELACELLGGLGRAHELGIIHRDIKPANILLTKDGRPKLTDFGLAKQMTSDHGQTVTGAVLGTIDFMPPEQRRDATLVDSRSDLWSLAATLYQILSGKSPKIIRFDLLPHQLVGVMGQALEESPAQRFQSAAEFRNGLRKVPQVDEGHAAKLVAGQCPQCGTRNSESVRYCKECSAALKVPCLQCEADIPIWDKGCTECGARQAESLERKRMELRKLQNEVERLREVGRLTDSLNRLAPVSLPKHPSLQDFQQWSDRVGQDLRSQIGRFAELADKAVAEARAHRAAWDYPAAIRSLKGLPEEAKGEEQRRLLLQVEGDWKEFRQLMDKIQSRIKYKQLDGLIPLVVRALALKGDRQDLKKFLMQLENREKQLEAFNRNSNLTVPNEPLPQRNQDVLETPEFRAFNTIGLVSLVAILLFIFFRAFYEPFEADHVKVKADEGDHDRVASVGAVEPENRQNASQELAMSKATLTPPSPIGSPRNLGKSPDEKPDLVSMPELTNSLGMKLRLLPPGTFTLGSASRDNDCRPHRVTLSKEFYIGCFEVTQEEFGKIMGGNPSKFKAERYPVDHVSWDDAVSFCKKLSETSSEKRAGRVYRLPTEAEWEYACRAASRTSFSFADSDSQLESYGWFSKNAEGQPHPVGERLANNWGLYDLHGNVWEWCSDWYAAYLPETKSDPVGPGNGVYKVIRGGAWSFDADACRSFHRGKISPALQSQDVGFRVVMTITGAK